MKSEVRFTAHPLWSAKECLQALMTEDCMPLDQNEKR